MKPSLPNRRLLLLALAALLLVGGGLLLRALLSPPPAPKPAPPVAQAPPRTHEVILYFGAADGTHLVAESRQIPDCEEEQQCLQSTLQALLTGPAAGAGDPVLPPGTALRGIHQDDQGLATVDFSNELVAGHPGGSMSELLSVYSVIDTLAVNFPYLRRVRFLVEGQPVATIKGHVDLRQPLAPDFSLTRPPAGEEGVSSAPAPAAKEQ